MMLGRIPAAAVHWSHLVGWWKQRDSPSLLLVAYEHMVEAPELLIGRMARFCDIPLDDELLALTLELSSRPFVLRHLVKITF